MYIILLFHFIIISDMNFCTILSNIDLSFKFFFSCCKGNYLIFDNYFIVSVIIIIIIIIIISIIIIWRSVC